LNNSFRIFQSYFHAKSQERENQNPSNRQNPVN
jgi:hypothetical protein